MTNNDGIVRFLQHVVHWGLIASLFSALFISTSTLFPFFVGKVTFLHTILTISLIAYLFILALQPDRITLRLKPLMISVLAYMAIYTISSFTSLDPYQSFWSTIERMEGLFHMLYFLLYFIMLSSFYRTKQEWLQFWRGSLVMGWLVGFYGIAQFLGLGDVLLKSSNRIAATLGNATYVGTMFIILGHISALLLAWDKRSLWKQFYVASLIFFVLLVVMSGTRGALLGIVASVVFSGFAYLIFAQSAKYRKKAATGLLVAIVAIVSLFSLARAGHLDSIEAMRRLSETDFSQGGVRARIINWEIAWDATKERPLLGWGPDTYLSTFSKDYNPEMLFHKNIWFDRVHSKQIEVLVTTGWLGLISYLGIFTIAFLGFFVTRKRDLILKILLASLFVGYFVQNISLFDTTTSYLVFFPALAFSGYLIHQKSQERTDDEVEDDEEGSVVIRRPAAMVLASALTLSLLIMLKMGTFNAFAASQQGLNGLRVLHQQPGNVEAFIDVYEEAYNYNTYVRSELNNQLRVTLPRVLETSPIQAIDLYTRYSIEKLEEAVALHPTNLKFQLSLGSMYRVLGDLRPEFQNEAERVLTNAAAIGLRPDAYFELSVIKEAQGDPEGAADVLEEYMNKSEHLQTPWRKAQIAFLRGNDEEAEAFIKEAVASENKDFTTNDFFTVRGISPESLQRLFDFYRETPNIATTTGEYYGILAILAARGGQGEAAIALLEQGERDLGLDLRNDKNQIRRYRATIDNQSQNNEE